MDEVTRLADPATRLSTITSGVLAPIARGVVGEVYPADDDLRLCQPGGGEPLFGRDLLE